MADRPLLIIVHGAPGTGKTTLSKKLSQDLGLPCLMKDDIKELLYDKLGVGDLKWSQDLGAGVSEMQYAFIEKWLDRGRSLIAENAYYHEFAAPRFKAMLQNRDVVCVEVYLKVDHDVRIKRFVARSESGQRHPGHVDHNHYNFAAESEELVMARYAPLGVGDLIEVDTTSFEDVDYPGIMSRIHACIRKQQKEGIR